jgi:large subunit ribosomal protein L21
MVKSKEDKKFAVIKIAGTQLKVSEGKEYEVNKLEGKKGDTLDISEVLLVSDGDDTKIGAPFVDGAKVVLEIKSQKKDDKVRVLKYKAKARYRRTIGHRAMITKVAVKSIA